MYFFKCELSFIQWKSTRQRCLSRKKWKLKPWGPSIKLLLRKDSVHPVKVFCGKWKWSPITTSDRKFMSPLNEWILTMHWCHKAVRIYAWSSLLFKCITSEIQSLSLHIIDLIIWISSGPRPALIKTLFTPLSLYFHATFVFLCGNYFTGLICMKFQSKIT